MPCASRAALGVSLLLIWIVASIVFLALHMIPGDPAELLLSRAAGPGPGRGRGCATSSG